MYVLFFSISIAFYRLPCKSRRQTRLRRTLRYLLTRPRGLRNLCIIYGALPKPKSTALAHHFSLAKIHDAPLNKMHLILRCPRMFTPIRTSADDKLTTACGALFASIGKTMRYLFRLLPDHRRWCRVALGNVTGPRIYALARS